MPIFVQSYKKVKHDHIKFAIIFCAIALLIPINPASASNYTYDPSSPNSASDPSTNIINSTDYKRGYNMGQLLAKCHDHAVINGSRLFINGFLDGYDTMNITKCQDIGFR